ncbi:MAG: site-specific integrase [Betaproteobacteria bacterium]
MAAHHEFMDGKLHVYKRDSSPFWQCSAFFAGRNYRRSTKEESLAHARDIAEDWYLGLKGKARAGELKNGVKFKTAADQFRKEYEAITVGERNAQYVEGLWSRLRVHILPFMGERVCQEVTPGLVQEYRAHRMTSRKDPKTGEPLRPSRSTLHSETIAIRHVLKCAERHGWIEYVPNISPPYKTSGKISHRAWFSPDEYKQLYEATRKRAASPPKARWQWACEQLHDFVLLMVNTGLRPDEAWRLEFRDVEIVEDNATEETILEIKVRGKRGTGYCKSMPGAVQPFIRLRDRPRPEDMGRGQSSAIKKDAPKGSTAKAPTDLLFPRRHRQLFNEILDELKLKKDREGNPRTFYSLRHTYISMRLMEGADIYQIAKNCRTSVEMIEKFYASHIKDLIDTAAINVRRERPDGRARNRATNVKRKKSGNPEKRI